MRTFFDVGQRPHNSFVRLPEVLALTGLSRSTTYSMIQQGRFPAPVKLTAHASGWRVGDLDAWLADPAGWRPDAANDNTGEEAQ